MVAGLQLSLPAIGAIGAGVILLAIVWLGWPFQRYPGAKTWTLILITVAVWDISYGLALTVFNPDYRWWFEIPIMIGRTVSIPLILVFALQYTGRGELVHSRWMYGLFGLFGGGLVLAVTNPLHQLMWTGYRIEPLFGAATVVYTPRLYYVVAGMSYMLILIAVALFADTIARYRSVFGRQVIALIVALIIPSIANIVWMFRVGPTQHLDLTPGGHLVAGTLLTYALFQEGMFEVVPATRHKAERAALDELAAAVLTVTTNGLILDLNAQASQLIDATKEQALLHPIGDYLDIEIPPEEPTFTLSSPVGLRNEYAVAVSDITTEGSDPIGYTISLQDITDERLRQQRLEVMNRILRHNLRNDLNVVLLLLEELESQVDDATEHTAQIRQKLAGLIEIGNKARSIERILTTEGSVSVTGLAEFVQRTVEEVDEFDDCTIEIGTLEGDAPVNASLLGPVLRELIRNGCLYNDAADPVVRVDATVDESLETPITITVTDNGPGIPEQEIATLKEGTEKPLQHGSGLGLWLVEWGVSLLNGHLEFDENTPRGSVVTLRIPPAS